LPQKLHITNPVHVEEPYQIEKAWFGINTADGVLTPNELAKNHGSTFLYVISGLFYLCWVPVPLLLCIYLFFKRKRNLLVRFSAAFLLTNLLGFILYYVYPAAPPWYVDLHGFEENFSIPGNVAGLGEFDQFFGISLFEGMYAKSSNVFAAIPSLHSAYPVVLFYYGMKLKNSVLNILFFIILLGIWFGAVYSGHHYIIDVILGALCAIFAILIFEKILLKSKLKELLDKYSAYISS
jgi:membrane-associated phospholipid phosphatase